MALTAIIRRSASTLAPLALRAAQAQRHHQSAVFTALNHTIFSSKTSSVPTDVFFQSRHGFATSPALKRPNSDEALLRIIESEIQDALLVDDDGRVEEIPKDFPFDIQDNPGEQTISLKRGYQGESIEIVVHMPDLISGFEDEDNDDDDDDNDANADAKADANADDTEKGAQSTISLTVSVSKKNQPTLEFEVTAYADVIEIDSMVIKDPETAEDTIAYEGPDFSDLDENLKKAFHKYLEKRGIKNSTTDFLHEYMVSKDSQEYCNWLKNLKKFVEA